MTTTIIVVVVMGRLTTKVVAGIDAHSMGGVNGVGCGFEVALGAC